MCEILIFNLFMRKEMLYGYMYTMSGLVDVKCFSCMTVFSLIIIMSSVTLKC